MFISFVAKGRTGNNIFQYIACKLIELLHGQIYISLEYLPRNNLITLNDKTFYEKINDIPKGSHILLDGYFQNTSLYVKYRKELLPLINSSIQDYWILDHTKYHIKDFTNSVMCREEITDSDVVVSLRLDDFIHIGNNTTEIVPPSFYTKNLDKIDFSNRKLFIICDKIKTDWETRYMKHFTKYNPIIHLASDKNDLYTDFAIFKNCQTLLHSNSTFCWIASFLSMNDNKKRIIPLSNFHGNHQILGKISETDIVEEISTLLHKELENL